MGGLLRFSSAVALLAVMFGTFRFWAVDRQPVEFGIPIRGQNDRTILFFALAESGQINVQLATSQALLEKHPDLAIHFASFSPIRQKVSHVSSFVRNRTPSAKELAFHELPGPDRMAAMHRQMNGTGALECLAHPPGARGAALLAQQLELALWPWSGEEHTAIYQRCIDIVEEIDPALVVIDFAFRPAIDAVEHLNRHHAIISPLALADIFGSQQPYGAALWKYPALVLPPSQHQTFIELIAPQLGYGLPVPCALASNPREPLRKPEAALQPFHQPPHQGRRQVPPRARHRIPPPKFSQGRPIYYADPAWR